MSETKPKRARTKRGTYQGDDPATPGVNEAWEAASSPAAEGYPPHSAAYKAAVLRGEIVPVGGDPWTQK